MQIKDEGVQLISRRLDQKPCHHVVVQWFNDGTAINQMILHNGSSSLPLHRQEANPPGLASDVGPD